MSKRLIVIGGTAAGLSAASKAKRDDPSIEVKVFEKSGYVSYGACGLPYFVGDMIKEPMDLVSLTVEELREKRNIPVFIRHEAVSVNRAKKTVTVKDELSGEIKEHPYDALVLATGALPIIPDIDKLFDTYIISFNRLSYNEKKLNMFLNKWLNDRTKKITAAYVIDENKFLDNYKDIYYTIKNYSKEVY